MQGFDDVSVSTIGLAILKALEYMHNSGRIHRDIKAGPSSEPWNWKAAPGSRPSVISTSTLCTVVLHLKGCSQPQTMSS